LNIRNAKWGNRRNPTTGVKYTTTPTGLLFARGFTGHEHVDMLGLIKMNGRFYDPALGLFTSPDNNIQAPDFTQNFNRYTYCLNNPLMYTDPDGDSFLAIALIFIIGSGIDYLSQVAANEDYNGGERWYKGIDWFDVGMGGVGAEVMVFAAPLNVMWFGVASPWLTNAVDIEYMEDQSNGWQIDIVGVKSHNNDGNYIEDDKMPGYYALNSGIQSTLNFLTYCAMNANNNQAFSRSPSYSMYNQTMRQNYFDVSEIGLKQEFGRKSLSEYGKGFSTDGMLNFFNNGILENKWMDEIDELKRLFEQQKLNNNLDLYYPPKGN